MLFAVSHNNTRPQFIETPSELTTFHLRCRNSTHRMDYRRRLPCRSADRAETESVCAVNSVYSLALTRPQTDYSRIWLHRAACLPSYALQTGLLAACLRNLAASSVAATASALALTTSCHAISMAKSASLLAFSAAAFSFAASCRALVSSS